MNANRWFGWGAAAFCLSAVGCGGKVADQTGREPSALSSDSSQCVPPLPSPVLAAPDGNRVAFHLDAIGDQTYTCSATGWVNAPAANLYDPGGELAGTHYAGPTWQADDGSTVKGKKVAAFTPDPTAIPWLLLQAVAHDGDGRMSDVTYIQRLDTTGGLGPAAGACSGSNLGEVVRAPYTATYYFYRAEEGDGDHGAASDGCP